MTLAVATTTIADSMHDISATAGPSKKRARTSEASVSNCGDEGEEGSDDDDVDQATKDKVARKEARVCYFDTDHAYLAGVPCIHTDFDRLFAIENQHNDLGISAKHTSCTSKFAFRSSRGRTNA